ncbi:pyrroline-5-carboxylate reductase [Spiroplasma helicoides]|uniref:Pyrroline-5-carboxylate reductase n=1 Tax=Spiroplasma helicoides TaxID=216938 RepID=A0A1B3SJT2_9MOLU|nr:pyrroline-5-carboxylate reductase dimerization domain-containing protein [Spiroplasma helicoides]AOG60185.1 pyrroline-5-carboxylate reductase [Spiroplasma helicoides]
MKKILMVGTGHMGEAILKVWAKELDKLEYKLIILNRNIEKSKKLAKTYDCNYIESIEDINKVNPNIIVLGFRPSDGHNFLSSLNLINQKDKLIISMLNAFEIEKISNYFSQDINIIRIMPNMNAALKKSTTAYIKKGKNINLINFGIWLISLFGKVYELEEDNFPSFVSLTGSAPAFIYEFIKGFKEFALKSNYDEKISNDFIKETIIASTEQALNNGIPLDKLIGEIIVPGGPTEAGHNVLKEKKFKDILVNCLQEAKKRG